MTELLTVLWIVLAWSFMLRIISNVVKFEKLPEEKQNAYFREYLRGVH